MISCTQMRNDSLQLFILTICLCMCVCVNLLLSSLLQNMLSTLVTSQFDNYAGPASPRARGEVGREIFTLQKEFLDAVLFLTKGALIDILLL